MIPKAELHCHLEGSIPPALARELAARNGVALPDGMFDGKGHYVWQDFLSFLDAYDRVCAALKVARDFGDVLYTYLKGAAAEGAVYVEMFCSPERPKALGISYDAWLTALEDAIDRARRDFGIEGRIVVDLHPPSWARARAGPCRADGRRAASLCGGLRHGG